MKARSDASRVGHLVSRVARQWRRAVDEELATYGLSDATSLALFSLSKLEPPVRQRDVAEELGVEGPSVVRIIESLVADDLVSRREDPADRRAKLLELTPSGRKRVAATSRIIEAIRADILGDIGEKDLAVATAVLEKILAALGRRGTPREP